MRPLKPLKAVATLLVSNVDKKTVEGETGVRLCNYVDVYYHDRITGALPFMTASATPAQIALFELRRGDILFTKDSETAADVAVSAYVPDDLPGVACGYHLAIARPRTDSVDSRYLFWALNSQFAREQFAVAATGVTRFGLRQDDTRSVRLPIPEVPTQRAIADYLDAETARIDALIAKKRHLIELLDERYHVAVEDTLWRDAPRFVRLKFICGSPSSGNRDHGSFGEAVDGVPCLRGLNVRPGLIDTDQLLYISPASHADHEASQLRTGDIVVVRSGLAGSAAVVPPELDDCNCVDLVIVRKSREVESRYVEYVINSRPVQQQVALRSAGALLKHFNAVDAAELLIPMYGESERRSLVLTLDSVRRCKDRGVSALGRQIDLLVEHRQALITAAVSGEFEVPGVAA